jgi:hemolysin activation/secretion protein
MKAAGRRQAWLASIALAAMFGSGTAFAQTAPPLPPQALPGGGPATLTQPGGRPEAVPQAPDSLLSTCPFAGQGLMVSPSSLTVKGATVVSAEEINDAVADLMGKSQDLSVVCELRDRVAALYNTKGYRLTRVELPAQRISGGAIELQAIEGVISSLTVLNAEKAGPSGKLVEKYLRRALTGRPLYWPDLERAILLARDVPGVVTDIKLRRSSAGPGAVELVADFSPRETFTGLISYQDLGAEDLGRYAGLLRLDANSLTPFGDQTSLVVLGSPTGEQYVVQLLEEIRIGSSGLVLTGDVSISKSIPTGDISALGVEGSATIARVGLRYPIERTRARSITLTAGFELIDQENKLKIFEGFGDNADVLSDDSLRVFTLGSDIRWRPDASEGQPPSGLDVRASLDLRRGIAGLGSTELGSIFSSRFEGDPEFLTVRAGASARWTFGGRPVGYLDPGGPWIEARVSAQWADRPLLAFEEYQVGNYTIGRGYYPGIASGENAIGGQIEAGWPMLKGFLGQNAVGQQTYAEPYIFFDAANVKNTDLFGYVSDIRSVGIGVRMRLPWELTLDFAIAKPLTEPFPGAETPDARFIGTISRPFNLPFR